MISIDQSNTVIPRQAGIYEDEGQTRKTFVCLEPGQYQFGIYSEKGYGFYGAYSLKLQSGETIIDRNRDTLGDRDSTVEGFGELVRFDLPSVTLETEAIGGNPTVSPTTSTQPSISNLPSLAPSISIRPSVSQSPSASQAPSIGVPRGATLVGQCVCADSSNERYRPFQLRASEFKEGVSTRLCLEKCLSLSSIMQLNLRGFERPSWSDASVACANCGKPPCACLFDQDSGNNGGKLTEELSRENGVYDGSGSLELLFGCVVKGVGPVSTVLTDCYDGCDDTLCYSIDNDVSVSSLRSIPFNVFQLTLSSGIISWPFDTFDAGYK